VKLCVVVAVLTSKRSSGACQSSTEMFQVLRVVGGGGVLLKDQVLPELEVMVTGPRVFAYMVPLPDEVREETLEPMLEIGHGDTPELTLLCRLTIMVWFACRLIGTETPVLLRVYCNTGCWVPVHESYMYGVFPVDVVRWASQLVEMCWSL
jgi:hypothetical protein